MLTVLERTLSSESKPPITGPAIYPTPLPCFTRERNVGPICTKPKTPGNAPRAVYAMHYVPVTIQLPFPS